MMPTGRSAQSKRSKLWVRFERDYRLSHNIEPSYLKGQVAELDAIVAECLVDCEYAVITSAPEAASFRERFRNATSAGG